MHRTFILKEINHNGTIIDTMSILIQLDNSIISLFHTSNGLASNLEIICASYILDEICRLVYIGKLLETQDLI